MWCPKCKKHVVTVDSMKKVGKSFIGVSECPDCKETIPPLPYKESISVEPIIAKEFKSMMLNQGLDVSEKVKRGILV